MLKGSYFLQDLKLEAGTLFGPKFVRTLRKVLLNAVVAMKEPPGILRLWASGGGW